jgi:hypothetical protein
MMGIDALQAIEQEVAAIHADMAKCHERLADAAARRDVLLRAAKAAAKGGGTVINVPAAKITTAAKI